MANATFLFLLIVYVVFINALGRDRRLVLHSETDVVLELNKLRTDLNDQKTVTQTLTNDIQKLTTKLAEKDAEIQAIKTDQLVAFNNITSQIKSKSSGSSYVRWGKNSCPENGTAHVYSGFMAGSLRTTTGGTSNYLCLSGQPTWDYYVEGVQGGARVSGVEYEFTAFSSAGRTNFFGSDIHNDDAPCTVCHTTRATNIMIPGRNTCYDGWTKEYSGYIVTEHNDLTHGTEYICLDRRPDVVMSGKNNDNENLLYLVEASCGKTLECPPYVHGRELACVVCSL